MTSFNPPLSFAAGQGQNDPFQGLSQEELQEFSATQLSTQDTVAFTTSGYHHHPLVQTINQLYPHQQSVERPIGQIQYQTGHSSIPGSPYAHPTNPISTSQASINPGTSPSTIHNQLSPEPFPVEMPNADLGGFEPQTFASVMNINTQPYTSQYGPDHSVYSNSGNQRPELSLQVHNYVNSQTSYDPASLNPEPLTAAMRSPIVRIETCDDVPPNDQGLGHSRSRHSISSRHLSPLGDEHSDDIWQSQDANVPDAAPIWSSNIDRGEDGSWITRESGQGGISPIDRAAMNSEAILSLDEQELLHIRAQTNANVSDWLSQSTNVSESGDVAEIRNIKRPRARSANDIHRVNQHSLNYLSVPPGPGAVLNEASDYDDDFSSFWSTYSGSDNEPTSPAVDLVTATQTNYYAPHGEVEFIGARPWTDDVISAADGAIIQPASSNEAIIAFGKKAKEVDNASLAATIGSRCRSETDIISLTDTVTEMKVGPENDGKQKESHIIGLVNKVISRSNSKKRKSSLGPGVESKAFEFIPEAKSPSFTPRRSISGRPRSPRTDTNISILSMEPRSPNGVMAATLAKAKNTLRSRSKSDIGKPSKSPGLTELLVRQGGLPGAGIMSTTAKRHRSAAQDFKEDSDDDDDDDAGATVSMDLAVKLDLRIIPNHDGFKHHILQLNPRIDPILLERLTHEQMKRFQRLSDAKRTHEAEGPRGRCRAEKYCTAKGGSAEFLPPRQSGRQAEASPIIFQVVHPEKSDNGQDDVDSGAIPAQFPTGIPLPPADQLPAKFECNYCFTAKECKKPSDWTKHVHEDVQPFTCTFPDCQEPKSFKRKADWVRHENERHRQLESWKCDWSDCNHLCHRRDNFVHHLCREHQVPEPRVRAARSGARSPGKSPLTPQQLDCESLPQDFDPTKETVEDYVQRVCDRCRRDAFKDPRLEPCRFCGNICTTWKKLTIHLAKHMEQITLPIIQLVQLHKVTGDGLNSSFLNPDSTMVPSMPAPISHDVLYYEEPGDIEPMVSGMSIMSSDASNQTSFLSPDLANHQNFGQQSNSSGFLDPNSAYFGAGTSYPPAVIPGRSSRASSFSDNGASFVPMRQGTTYPPTSFDARMLPNGADDVNRNLGLDHHTSGPQSGPDGQPFYGFNDFGDV